MLSSWRSWSMTLLVTLIYCYMMSEWCREKLRPAVKVATWPIVTPIRSTYQGGIARKVGVLVLLIAAWAAGEVPELPLMEWGWLGISLLALLLLLCKGFRACILSTVVAIGSCIMSVFATACTTAASLCFESSLLADAAVMGGGAAVAAEGAAGATAVAEAGATVEATAAADAALGVEGTAAADVAAGGAAAGEAATAAEAAAAAEAVAAADAAVAAEGLGLLALCAIQTLGMFFIVFLIKGFSNQATTEAFMEDFDWWMF
eukprot:g25558.t1